MTTPTTAALPQLASDLFLTDGGLETTLVFHDGIELPDFAAFPLLDTADGRESLRRYFRPYFDVAEQHDLGFIVDTPTWRANLDWGARLGFDPAALGDINRRSVQFSAEIAHHRAGLETVINGVIGPRGDGYVVGGTMSADEAASYHALQTRAFAAAGADMVTAVTMTYADEAIGITRAGLEAGLPVVVSFTVETDGRLPSGQGLAEAIASVDAATDHGAAYFMINCAHPTHFDHVLGADAVELHRVKAVRANASRRSHAELDEADELDRGDLRDLAEHYRTLRSALPDLRVVGGCCGTDHEHIAAMAAALTSI